MQQNQSDRHDPVDKVRLTGDAETTSRADLVAAMTAACALISHADGKVDATERRRVLQLMRALPAFGGFSSGTVAEEFARHERAFATEPFHAREKMLDTIEDWSPSASEVQMLLFACQHVLEADGIFHPQEYQALSDVGKALGAG